MHVIALALMLLWAPKQKPRPKPTKAEQAAIDVAKQWPANAAAKFFGVMYTEDTAICKPSSDPACVKEKVALRGTPHVWRRTLSGPLAEHHHAQIDQLGRGAITVEVDDGCGDGQETQVLLVVKAKQVIAVFAQTVSCSE
ncbi:MAG: hypothetical protein QM831_10410 [Kofleriaceae bacterium]